MDGQPNAPACCRRLARPPAGEPIATRWTPEIKAEVRLLFCFFLLLPCCCLAARMHVAAPLTPRPPCPAPSAAPQVKRSRVAVTAQLAAAINACPPEQRPKVLVNASAVGYYGSSEVSAVDCWWGWGMKVHCMCAMLEQLNTAWHVPCAAAVVAVPQRLLLCQCSSMRV